MGTCLGGEDFRDLFGGGLGACFRGGDLWEDFGGGLEGEVWHWLFGRCFPISQFKGAKIKIILIEISREQL